MKIAFVSDAIYPYNKGGKEKRLFELTTRLAGKGHQIDLYCMNWWQGPRDKIENGVHLHAICKYYPLYSKDRRSMIQALVFGLACLKLIRKDFDIVDVDHMPHFPLFTAIVCLFKRKRMIASWHEVWGRHYWQEYLGYKGIFGFTIEKLSVLMSKEIIADSKHTADRLKSILRFKNKIYIISNGNDFEKIQEIKSSEIKSDVIFAGRLLSNKNIDVLIKSIQSVKVMMPEIRCVIIGDGPEKKRLNELAQKLGLEKNINFLGFLKNHDDVYALIKSSKVFVFTSTREGFGIVVVEANACGIPVIAIDHEGNAAKDLIEEEKNGFLCQLDADEIAKDILRIIKSETDLKMRKACLDLAKQYDWDKIVEEIEAVYLKMKMPESV